MSRLSRLPALNAASNLALPSAAIAYGGLLALHYLRRGRVHAGDRVLVYGASGAGGTAAVQLARRAGAVVTGVCGPGNAELVLSLGGGPQARQRGGHRRLRVRRA